MEKNTLTSYVIIGTKVTQFYTTVYVRLDLSPLLGFLRASVLSEVRVAAVETVLIFVIKTDFLIGEVQAEADAAVKHQALSTVKIEYRRLIDIECQSVAQKRRKLKRYVKILRVFGRYSRIYLGTEQSEGVGYFSSFRHFITCQGRNYYKFYLKSQVSKTHTVILLKRPTIVTL
jgi:hypothetical protein